MQQLKSSVSYSEIRNWLDCAWRHKLLYVDKVGEFRPGIYSDFGSIIHDACEGYLRERLIDKEAVVRKITAVWTERGYPDVEDWPKFESAVPDLQYWIDCSDSILDGIPAFLDEKFEGWEYVAAESRIFVPTENAEISFKGFIDGIIKTTSKKGRVTYHIVDWKTSGPGGWHPSKVQDFKTHLQLMLYKIFWAQEANVSLRDVKCGFILLKRLNPHPKRRKKLTPGFVSVSVGPKSTERSLKVIRNMLSSLEKGIHLKNRTSCDFCEFYKTEHCR